MPGPSELSPKLSATTPVAPLHEPQPPQAKAQPAAPRRSLEGIAHREFNLQSAGRPETSSLAIEQAGGTQAREATVAVESPQDKRSSQAEPLPQIAQVHRPANTSEERMKAAVGIVTEASARVASFQTEIQGHHYWELPPARTNVTARHVEDVLTEMVASTRGLKLADFEDVSLDEPSSPYVAGSANIRETIAPGSSVRRFGAGIRLTEYGREILAMYYTRKYNADIAFSEARGVGMRPLDRRFIEAARQKPGQVVRCAQYLGHVGDIHGTLLVYTREGGREALLWFDSMSGGQNLDVGIALAAAAAPLALDAHPMTVFQYAMPLQRDYQSCWVYAMKTAVTLTGRKRDGHGGFGDFMIPDLIGDMEARRLNTPTPAGANPVWAPPEVARTSQFFTSILAHAGDAMDQPLRGARPGVTLRSFLEKYTYEQRDGDQILDYMRQKGERLAEIADIEAWNQQIGKTVGPEIWGTAQQNEFVTRMKELVRGVADSSDEDNNDELELLAGDPEPFVEQQLNG